MKLLIVTQYFYPDTTSATGKILTELAEDLSGIGTEVCALSSFSTYSEGKTTNKRDTYQGIEIERVWSFSGNKNNNISRLLNYITFFFSVFFRLFIRSDYDCILFVSNPPIVPFIGHIIKKIKGKKYIYLIHDLYPDIAVKLNVVKEDSIMTTAMNYLNNKIFKSVDKIIVLGKDMEDVLLKKGVNKNKLAIVTNWADKEKIFPASKVNAFSLEHEIHDTFNILYTGNIGRFHDVETIIQAAVRLKEHKKIRFVFIGEGFKKKHIEQAIVNNNLNNIIMMSYQPEDIYNNVLASADLFVATLDNGVEGLAVPSKTYSYLAAGRPIVAIMSDFSEIGSMVEENNLGIRIDIGETDKLVDFILKMCDNKEQMDSLKHNVVEVFNKYYERKKVTTKFYDEIRELQERAI